MIDLPDKNWADKNWAEKILDSTRDAFVAMDADGMLIAWNGAAEAMFGYGTAEALGRDLAELIVPAGLRAVHRAAVGRYVETRIPQLASGYNEFDALHRDGRTFPVEITHWQVESGDDIVFYAFLRDISDRRAREQELARRRAREAELTYRTMHDGLTGLPNRNLALDRLVHALTRQVRHGGDVAVLFVDLDRFKLINDSLGHDAGDEMLRVTAARLSSVVRASDLVARVSGDEFVIVCDELDDHDEAMAIADRVLQVVQEPVNLAGERARIRASIGIAFADQPREVQGQRGQPSHATMAEDLLRDADAAMYRAKERGRGQIAVFDSDMRQRLRNELRMEREITECLDRGQLAVWYRPVFDLRRDGVSGMQPIVVWHHPRLGLLTPDLFTPVAEEIGIMPSILDWALREICRQAVRWRGGGTPEFSIDMDLTARQLSHPGLVPSITAALQETGLDGSALTVSMLPPAGPSPSHDDDLLAALDAMRSLDIAVGINGCGVESAVLSWLADVPFDMLRIAPGLGESIRVRERADFVISALVAMGHDMGMTISIDGIRTEEQRDRALALGCDLAQGPLLGELAPPDRIS